MTETAAGGLPSLSTDDFTLYSKLEYLRDITGRIQAAGKDDVVTIVSMGLDPLDRLIGQLIDALVAAASRGVKVLLLTDAYNFLITLTPTHTRIGPLLTRRTLPADVEANHPIKQAMRRLEAAGGRAAVTNLPRRPFLNPFAGRSHIKLTLINDRVYIGGCNLDTSDETDIMAGWDDAATAGWLRGLAEAIYQQTDTRTVFKGQDIERQLDDRTTLLIDSGKPQQSAIYYHALRLIDEARESVFITCQYFPNHLTARHLAAARRRGAKVTIVYNHPAKDTWPMVLLHRLVVRFERLRNPPELFAHELPLGTPFLHAKVLATESAGMVGSHNYVRAGVNWGTAETALLCRDPAFARALVAKTEAAIAIKAA